MSCGADEGHNADKAPLHGIEGHQMIERARQRLDASHTKHFFCVSQMASAEMASARKKEIGYVGKDLAHRGHLSEWDFI